MFPFDVLGKSFILIGIILVLLGLILTFSGSLPFKIGRLPGDIYIKKDNFTFYFPLATSILLSLILTLIFYFLRR